MLKKNYYCFKKIIAAVGLFFIFTIMPTCFAAGGVTHMLIAQESIALLHDTKLRNLLLSHMDAYLVGSNYPDSGYVAGTHFGEDSHWEPFITAFIAHLKNKYPYPVDQDPNLVAFLLGCATHSRADIIFHWTFINKVALEDFHGDWNKAHTNADGALDMFILVEKNQWTVRPRQWWVPVDDLVAIYHRMSKDQYTASEIRWGNTVHASSGIGERVVALEAYPFIKLTMPWTTKHYYDAPEGGILMNEKKVAEYVEEVWRRLLS